MYIELDGDDVAVTYIKDIVFNANRQDVEVLRMTKVLLESFFFSQKFFIWSIWPAVAVQSSNVQSHSAEWEKSVWNFKLTQSVV